ncbi:penicillin acylase family protein [Acidisoma cellulosilytica]|uniref:Penicillin acylase family protein n=1 Tax=Acidisoma cellulosilyticum TaxID=2802395 RepID=A0A963YYW2_9PROT|nr:penicillin acylase family protein [Acidisoma cellulosilyticum]MCB8878922.1 penicillin acylase family protein [Acidisoma cellulosilyticum]
MGIVLGLLVVVLAALIWRILPPQDDTLQLAAVTDPVGVTFDSNDIPFIRASSDTDAAAALGYIHARDRFFQMDLMRRAAAGDLAALLGSAALPNDREMRMLGIRESAEADLHDLSPTALAELQAYADGVNAWLRKRGRFTAPEYLLLGKPAPWTVVDSLLWGKTMGLWLSGNWGTELSRLALSGKMSRAKIDQLWPAAHGNVPAADEVQAGLPYPKALAALAENALSRIRHFPQPFTQPAQASNEWAVSGAHTDTGQPLLAGDPHLAFGFPGIWYLARIDTPEGMLAGATVPGLPFVLIGHNEHVAWTFTTTGADTQDIFIEHVTADGQHYETPDGPLPFGHRREVIHVRGAADVVMDVRTTRHGPVIADGPEAHTVLAVEMGNLAPHDTDADGLMMLNHARWVSDVGLAAPHITSPVQNLMTVDTAGNIALYTTGRVPIRRSGDGAWPVDGADGRHDWTGWAAGDALPQSVNPPSGVLVNANEPTVRPGFPVNLGRDTYGDWRGARIRDLLAAQRPQTLARFAGMQMDVVSVYARRLIPALTAVSLPANDPAAPAATLLQHWDGSMARDLPQPLVFNAWIHDFGEAVLKANGVDPDDAPVLMDSFVQSLLRPAPAGSAPDKDGPVALWCQGDCQPLLKQSLEHAVADLKHFYGSDPSDWRWGAVHAALFAHPVLTRLPVLGFLGRTEISVPGDATTVDVAAPGFLPRRQQFTALHGPELRGVYDISNLDRSLFVIAPGQSGDILDPHAFDFLQRWRAGGRVQLGPEPNVVSRQIRIMPKSHP